MHGRAERDIADAVLTLAAFIDAGAPSGAADPEHADIQINVFPLEPANLGRPQTDKGESHCDARLSLALEHCECGRHLQNGVMWGFL